MRWSFQTKQNLLLNHTYFKDCESQKFVTIVLITYVIILTEPDAKLDSTYLKGILFYGFNAGYVGKLN